MAKRQKQETTIQKIHNYELANEYFQYKDNMLAEREYKKIKKLQRKFQMSKGWRSYTV